MRHLIAPIQAPSRCLGRAAVLASLALCAQLNLGTQLACGQTIQFQPVITTYAGGAATVCAAATDSLGDGCPATQAILASPHISDTDAAGNLYIPDTTNNVVRRVDAVTGIITTFAGGATTVCAAKTDTVGDGCPATQATLNQPKGLRVDAFGNVVIADLNNNRIRSVNAQTGIITTIAGTGVRGSTPFANGTLANAIKFYSPFDLTFDASGNLYVADYYDNYVVLILAVNGIIVPTASPAYVLAGNGTEGYTGDGGQASLAEINEPRGLTVDASGNLYIADFVDSVIRRVTSPFKNGAFNLTNAIISTYAGNGVNGYNGDGLLATQAAVAAPQGVTTDLAGNLYIAQYGAGFDVIRKVNPTTQIISSFAGTGTAGFSGDGGSAISAKLYSPAGINIDRFGRIFIADSTNNRMRLVQPSPLFPQTAVGASSAPANVIALATQSVTLSSANVAAGSQDFSLGTMTGCNFGTLATAGAKCVLPATFTPLAPGLLSTSVVLTDSSGNRSVTGLTGTGTAPAVAFTPAAISTLAGNGTAGSFGNGGPASIALVNAPAGATFDASGSLVFADAGNNVIRRIDGNTGVMTVLAGTGVSGYTGDSGSALAATLNAPSAVVFGAAGNLFIADTGNNVIRSVCAATGVITTVAGTGTAGYTGDLGLATSARLNQPKGMAISVAGELYVADSGNNVIRRFYPVGGTIQTIAGTGVAGFSGNAGPANAAQLNLPTAIAMDASGNLYIADQGNDLIRAINPAGIINTYAGTQGISANSGDGGLAINSALRNPSDLAIDAAGDLYIASYGSVRVVNPADIITTLAGNGQAGVYSGDGGLATNATIPAPASNLALDRYANLYLSDTAGDRILSVSGATAPSLNFGTQAPNTTSTPQSVTLTNVGNMALSLSNIAVSGSYTWLSATANSCSSASVLAAGASCILSIEFTPTSNGILNGTLVITDNALNKPGSTQTISLTGNAQVPTNPTTTSLKVSSAAQVYGNSFTLTATIAGTGGLTGTVAFSINGLSVGTMPVVNGAASLTVAQVNAGQQTFSASYSGDTNDSPSSATVSIAVSPAVLTVTAANQTRVAGLANPTFTYSFSGFLYSDTSSVVSGAATFTTAATLASPAGQYPIVFGSSTLSAANYTFIYTGATLTVTPPDFTITASPTSFAIATGQTASTTITLTPIGSYQSTINLACGTLPAYVTCNFTSSSNTLGSTATTQLLIATDNFNHLASSTGGPNPFGRLPALLAFAGLPWVLLLRRRTGRSLTTSLVAAAAFVVLAAALIGCANATRHDAAPGTSTIVVSAKDQTGLTHSVNLTLTLQ
jgi:sugar lactone lactonase YvrE